MTEDKKSGTANRNQTAQNEPVHGRTHNSQNPEFEDQGGGRDISEIDQQEGNMNHGETGDLHKSAGAQQDSPQG